ncbi:hypothetical protein FXO38_05469 [Capsicum annuum]|uniref:Lsm14-like N-terminal domain-containing protein n=1 Tax=Capsicum annuum TaxID=4072 RepID=A0A2G3A3F7_CAPAN|nr:hypothetical protein FXO38_05469 [Capsicum annuum]KAF3676604.1 hypothetical protein FXO37_05255 [Capsicum annuum]PHT88730.1 hypothetical protein T459_10836 [Capsicum annuum]
MAPPSDQRGMAAWVVNLYIGCYVSLITKANIRYEGYLFHLGPHGEQVGLKKVKCFGTEGRQREGPQVSANFTILEYIFFRGLYSHQLPLPKGGNGSSEKVYPLEE